MANKRAETRLKGEKSVEGKIRYRIVAAKTDEARTLSTGAGTFGGSETQGLVVKIGEAANHEENLPEKRKIVPAGWELFTGILDALKEDSRIKTRITSFELQSDLYSQSYPAGGIYFPVLMNRKNAHWSFLDNLQTRRRQAMLAEILIEERFFYLLDTEVKTDDVSDRYSMILIYKDNHTEVEEGDWRTLLSDAAKFRGGKRSEWRWQDMKRKNFRHDLKNAGAHARRLLDFCFKF